jgi:tetratricopeptide (TPR) repeat protein
MGRDDWFRNTQWNEEIEAAFRSRLSRSRGLFHKTQYLRIQGYGLLSSEDAAAQAAGVTLMNELLADYPDNDDTLINKFNALSDLGYYYAQRGLWDAAHDYLKKAFEIDRFFVTYQSSVLSLFIKSTVLSKHNEDYARCDQLLVRLEKTRELTFPSDIYAIGLSAAMLYHEMGWVDAAKRYANIALHALGMYSEIEVKGKVFGEASATEQDLRFLTSLVYPPNPSKS